MISEQYNELRDISRRKFNENGDDILHDLILKFPNDFEKIKAYLLTQNHLFLKYETIERRDQREHELFRAEKQCACCKEIKKACEFYIINKPKGQFLHSYCKECVYLKKKNWIANNKERENERLKKYYLKNKDYISKRNRLKQQLTGYYKRFYWENRERLKAYNKEWRAKNKEKTKQYKQTYRHKLKVKNELQNLGKSSPTNEK